MPRPVHLVDRSGLPVVLDSSPPPGALTPVIPAQQALLSGDNAIAFGQTVRSYTVQNNTAATIYRALDRVASAGSLAIPPGYTLSEDAFVTTLHLYLTQTATANGTATGGLVIEGGA